MKANYLLDILSEDKKGLVGMVTTLLNRNDIEIECISTARTDIHSQVLVSLQLFADADKLRRVCFKINNIIEIETFKISLLEDSWYQKTALFTLDKNGYDSAVNNVIQKYGATLVGVGNDDLIIQKIGRDEDIQLLYNALEGKYLKSFCKSAAISLQPLHLSEEPVIRLAA
jgi:acetolactate synthase small subunit